MRIGLNPNKYKKVEKSEFFHQIIIPIYIPNHDGYFKDSFEILKYCLESLFKTSHKRTFFTIISNGSCLEVSCYLNTLFLSNKIHELIHTTNVGKLNSILKGVVGHQFALITITDCDVLFLNNWQEETYSVFENFPKAGVVSTTPSSKMIRYLTSNVLFEKALSKNMQFTEVKSPEAMVSFARSIGNPNFYNKYQLKKYLSISNKNVKAVIGAGHFVATYNSLVFEDMLNIKFSTDKMGSSLRNFLDKPVIEKGYWRLSTADNFTYHMGNISEKWMIDYLKSIEDVSSIEIERPTLKKLKVNKYFVLIKEFCISRILAVNFIWTEYLGYKGLSKEAAKKY